VATAETSAPLDSGVDADVGQDVAPDTAIDRCFGVPELIGRCAIWVDAGVTYSCYTLYRTYDSKFAGESCTETCAGGTTFEPGVACPLDGAKTLCRKNETPKRCCYRVRYDYSGGFPCSGDEEPAATPM
jgi:hypothetical protein